MATDSPRSPTAAVANGGGGGSPHSSRRRNLPSPWSSVVRGDSDQISSPNSSAGPGSSSSPPPEQIVVSEIEVSGPDVQPEGLDVNGEGNADRSRRPAWNRPVNGVVEAVSVMGGAVSWPALSESTRPVPRSSSDSFRPVSDGSSSPSQVDAPIISPPPQRQANNNAHSNSSASNTSSRPRTRNRGGGGGGGGGNSSGSGQSQNSFSRPAPQTPTPAPPRFPVFEPPHGMVPPMMDPVRAARPVGGPGGSQSHTGNDHSSHRNTSRRGGYGPRPRGDGSYQNNHGGRRDQDRRDVHLPPQFVPPPLGYMPSPLPPGATPFMSPPPVRVFTGQMGYDMASPLFYVPAIPPESFRAMPMPPPPPAMLFSPANENPLTMMIVKQIDYYFSDDNLVKDNFLRSNMDEHGWVPITLIASFRRVQQLTKDIPLILDSLRYSSIVEVQGDKVRRHNDWQRWLHSSSRRNSESGSLEAGASSETALTTSLQEVSLDDSMTSANGDVDTKESHAEVAADRILSEKSTGQSSLPNGEDASEEVRS